MKKIWLGLLTTAMCGLPILAFADTSVHASGFVRPLLTIIVIIILASVFLWGIDYWRTEMTKVWPTLPKILTFIVCIIAIIWIILILAEIFGVHIT